jgi:hypothetical protein
MENRTCYLMVRDVSAEEGEAALEWGVEFGLKEGETLPEDHEELTEAQFTVFKMVQILRGVFEDSEVGHIMGEEPSRLIVPGDEKD